MSIMIGIVEVVPVGLAEVHIVIVHSQIQCSLLSVGSEHDVVQHDIIDKPHSFVRPADQVHLGHFVTIQRVLLHEITGRPVEEDPRHVRADDRVVLDDSIIAFSINISYI